ncbi:RNA 3'-terminal phosphate cyclase [Actibacterium sp. MT2.3-13A]|uniref:RNA 3'-terminal phosphate cyclase n=1 Tax=Actibacterium sp. MT2.3-13A TaxID=2828332 RepID=UPI001BACA4EB|nr:RNA 3'-terminal phosphate cyclase [Actibacterium sp. MT2.3-13A]
MRKPRQSVAIDGSHGEGGGQILRTALGLSAITGRPLRIERIRADRRNPGLAAQHLASVRAVAAICDAALEGDAIASQELDFTPRAAPRAAEYAVDVATLRAGGSAGSAVLILQAMLLPLSFAAGASSLTLRGGTHVPWSPPFDYAHEVWLPALARMGLRARIRLRRSGWYPAGGGEIAARIEGRADPQIAGLGWAERGPLVQITGRALVANLDIGIAERMARRAAEVLDGHAPDISLRPERMEASCAGAGLCLTAHYAAGRVGFNALGRRGRPAEAVAEAAAQDLLRFHASGASVDAHLADQLLLPMALATAPSVFLCPGATSHLRTNAWVIERFGLARVAIGGPKDGPVRVSVRPASPGG